MNADIKVAPKYSIVFFLAIMIHSWSMGQSTVLHLDKPFYVAGEYVLYSFSNPQLPEDSLLAQIIVHSDSRILSQNFVQVVNQKGNGYFKSGYDLVDGPYGMQINIFEETGEPVVLYSGFLDIFSDQSENHQIAQNTGYEQVIPLSPETVSIQEVTHDTRENIEVSFDLSEVFDDTVQQVSVAIREDGYKSKGSSIRSYEASLPEGSFLNSIPLFGQRRMIGEHGIQSKLVFGCDSRTFRFVITQVDEEERFLMQIPAFTGEREIQFIDYLRRPFMISKSGERTVDFVNPTLESLEGVGDYIADFATRKKIYQLYSTVPQQVDFVPVDPDVNNLDPDYEVDVTDLSLRGRLVTVFKELSTPLKMKLQKDSTYEARVIYETADRKEYYSRESIFIVNGKITHNAHFIAQLPIQDVKHVKIFNQLEKVRQAFGPVGSGGIIDIEMVDPLYSIPDDIRVPSLRLQGMQPTLVYPVQVKIQDAVPAVSPLLYWNPSLVTGEEAVSITVPAGDDRTSYQVEVLVRTRSGNTYIADKSFTVSEHSGS